MTGEPDRWKDRFERLQASSFSLHAEIGQLRALVKELADDLEAEVEGHYHNTKNSPSELRRYERDMDSVRRARAALEPKA